MSSTSSSSLYLVLESGSERKIASSNPVLRLVEGLWASYETGSAGARYILYLCRPMKCASMGKFLHNTCNFEIDSFQQLDDVDAELGAHRYWSVYYRDGRERARLAQNCRAAELRARDGGDSEALTELASDEVSRLREENKALQLQFEQLTRLNWEVSQSVRELQAPKARVLQLEAVLVELESRLVSNKMQNARDLVAAHDLLAAERNRRRLACECAASTVNAVGCKFGATACAESMALALDYFALQRGAEAPRALSHGCEQLRSVIPPHAQLCYTVMCRFLLQLDERAAAFLQMLVCTAQPVGAEMAEFLLARMQSEPPLAF